MRTIALTVNGVSCQWRVQEQETASAALRRHGLTGTKTGCDSGTCGSCTVLVDGEPTLACLELAVRLEGRRIETIEGMAEDPHGQRLQDAFGRLGAAQCGICTPGMIMSATAQMRHCVQSSREQIKQALSGNLCRCTGYVKIWDAVEEAARTRSPRPNAVAKVDHADKASGAAAYVADLALPNTVVGRLLRSPHAHARIRSIDLTAALAVPGVLAIITGEDLPIRYGIIPWAADETALAQDEVFYVGQAVAAVAAADEKSARAACCAIRVDYEVLPAALSVEQAMAKDAPLVHHVDAKGRPRSHNIFKDVRLPDFGDVDGAFARAVHVVDRVYRYPASNHAAIETHGALAQWQDGALHVWSSTQVSHYLRKTLAKVLDIAFECVRVTQPAVGGGFGGKSDLFDFEICAAKLAQVSGRPVKIIVPREDVFVLDRSRHPTTIHLRLAVDAEGRVLAVENDVLLDGGAYASFGPITPYYLMQLMGGPIKIGALRARARRIYTNKPPQGPKRGHGTPQARFAFEMALNEAACLLGLDPFEIRRRNAIASGERTVNGFLVPSSGILACLDAVEAASGWKQRRGALPRGWGLALAVGMYICGTAYPIDAAEQAQSNVELERLADGSYVVRTAANDIGQGLGETLRRIVSTQMHVSLEAVRVVTGDTALGPPDLGAYSSRGALMVGAAAHHATQAMRERLAEGDETPTVVGTFLTIPVTGGDYQGSTIGASPTYSMTAAVALVEVDEKTGRVRTHKIWMAHDCGRAINPVAVEGQIEGSASMGDSEARLEEIEFDEATGLQLGPNLLGHPIATSSDAPEIETIIVETDDPMTVHGAKEAGEGPLLPVPPAIASAVHHATGVWACELPLRPDRVLTLIQQRATEVTHASAS